MSPDVFEEGVRWSALSDDPGDVGPDVSGVVGSSLAPGDGERLARVAGRDEIHSDTPRSTIEGSDVTVDRSLVEQTIRHALREYGGGVGFPLHITDGAVSGHCEGEPEFEPSNPGT